MSDSSLRSSMPLASRHVVPSFVVASSLLFAACGDGGGGASSASAAASTAKKSAAPPASTPAPASSPAPAASSAQTPATSGGACALPGTWTGNYPAGPFPFSGTPLDMTFDANGTGKTVSQRTQGDAPEFAWKLDQNHLAFHGVADTPKGGKYSCAKDDEGKYTLTFAADCASFTAKLESDPCKGRSMTMDGLTLKKK